jgi:hypothetical protein
MPDLEGDAVEGDPVAEALRQPLGRACRSAAAPAGDGLPSQTLTTPG